MIKAIIFDFFGVVCSDEYWQFVRADRQTKTVFQDFADEVNLGLIHWQEFVKKVAAATGRSTEEVNKMYASESINPILIGYITQLRQKYKTALLTNAHYEFLEPILKQAHLNDLFDAVVISSRVGYIKPAPEIFQYTLGKLSILSEEAVFIDDMVRHVQAAESLGLHSILYQNFPQMKRDLEKILASQKP